jgi:polysaccharide biosynthesis protein PslG
LAGMTGASWDALASLYGKGRVRGAFDVAALQTYTGTALHLLHAVHLFRGVLIRHHARRLPLWITEMGWPAAQGRIRVPPYQRTIATTDRGMAARLEAGYALITREWRRANALVSRVYWYTWASPYAPSRDPGTGIFRYAGLYRYNGSNFVATPSFRAYERSARQHER